MTDTKKKEKKKTIKPGPPKNKDDYSSNWKKMFETIAPVKRKRKADDSDVRHPKPKKLKKTNTEGNETEKSGTEKRDVHGNKKDTLIKDNALTFPTKCLAMDCEMVGIGKEGTESVLARVSLVNQHGYCVYDKFVRPREKVTDFRTHVSGVRPINLKTADDFLVVQKEVSDMLKDRTLVGHALTNDLKVLFLDHSLKNIRDTQHYKPFRVLMGGGRPSLKKLSAKVLGVAVQEGEHNSIQDAQAAMAMYMMHRRQWEATLFSKGVGKKTNKKKQKKAASSSDSKTVRFAVQS